MLGYLLKYVLKRRSHWQASETVVITDAIPLKKRRRAIEKAIKTTLGKMLHADSRYRIIHHDSGCHYGLQIADYCCWAVFRKHESGEPEYLDRIKSAVLSEFDIFSSGTTYYY